MVSVAQAGLVCSQPLVYLQREECHRSRYSVNEKQTKRSINGVTCKSLWEDLPTGHKGIQAIINLLPLTALSLSHSPHSPSPLPVGDSLPTPSAKSALPPSCGSLSFCIDLFLYFSGILFHTSHTHIVTTVFSPSLSFFLSPPPPPPLSLSSAWSYQYSSLNVSLNGSLYLDAFVCCS